MAVKEIRLRWPGTCATCEATLPKGAHAWWDSEAKAATCEPCQTGVVPMAGEAGESAQREYEKRSQRERRRKEKAVADDAAWREKVKAERPVLGRIAAFVTPRPAIGPESQATKAWADGAAGERALGAVLGGCRQVHVLNDRRLPGTKSSNIDHVVVAASGVYVVDAKNYGGKVELRGSRLFIGNRNRTKLLDGMAKQVAAVRAAVEESAPVVPVLCFVACDWPLLNRKGFTVAGVRVLWPNRLADLLAQPGDLSPAQTRSLADRLAAALPAN